MTRRNNSILKQTSSAPRCAIVFACAVLAFGTTACSKKIDANVNLGVTAQTSAAQPTPDATPDAAAEAIFSKIADVSINEDETKVIAFEAPQKNKALECNGTYFSYTSSNTALVAAANGITFAGTYPNCTATLAPVANAFGSATITLTFVNEGKTATTEFALAVAAVNDAPVVATAGDTTLTTNEDTAASINLPSATDVDNAQAQLNFVQVTAPTKGALGTLPTVPATGTASLSYTPSANANGADTFVYKVCDSQATPACTGDITVSISITPVDDSPLAANVTPVAFNEDTESTITLSYSDADNDKATACTISNLSNITVTTPCACSGTGVCTVGVTGTANYNGSAGFSYTVTANGATSNTANATLTINAVNDSPVVVAAGSTARSANLGSGATILLSSATDVDNTQGQLSYVQVTAPAKGTLGTLPSVPASGTANLTFTPSATGSDTFVYKICDNASTPACTGDISVSLTIAASNTTPTLAVIGGQATPEDTSVAVGFTAGDVDGPLACSGAYLFYTSSDAAVVAGTGAVVWSGTWGSCTGTITPVANASGSANITFTVNDGLATASRTFSLTVVAEDDAPIAGAIAPTAFNEDTQSVVTLLYSDQENDKATACATSALSNVTVTQACACDGNGVCTVGVTGTANYNGSASFAYTVTANGVASNAATATLTINAVEDAPVSANISPTAFNEETQSVVTLSYSDAENDKATACTVSGESNVTVTQACACDGNGVCTVGVTGTANYSGSASFAYTVTANGQTSGSATASLTINNVDDAPVASNISPTAFNEDTQSVVTLSYADQENNKATACATSSLSGVTVTQACACDGAGVCTVGVTGTANYSGSASFAYTVTANGATSGSATASLSITAVDDAPVAANISPTAFNEDTQSVVTLSYTDQESHIATACATSALSNVTVTQACACDGAGVCTVGVTGTSNHNGSASFAYTVTANGLTSGSATATLSITAVDDAPVASNITPAAFNQDTQSVITLSYTDAESHQATACAVSGLTNVTETQACACSAGTCTVGVTGTSGYTGSASFSYTVTANGVASNSATATLTINSASTSVTINRGSAANPVLPGAATTLDFVVTFPSSVTGVTAANFSLAETGSNKGASGKITSVSGSGTTWTVQVNPGNAGNLRLDLSSTAGITPAPASTHTGDQYYTLQGWYQEAYIKAPNSRASYGFAYYGMAIDGDTLAVQGVYDSSSQTSITNGPTAPSDTTASTQQGSVHVFRRTGTTWAQEAYIKAANAYMGDKFGMGLTVSGDTLAVGSPGQSSNQTTITNGTGALPADHAATASGAVYVYKRSGTVWEQDAFIKSPMSAAAIVGNALFFGGNSTTKGVLAISGDTLAVASAGDDSASTTIVNGATMDTTTSASDSGAVFVYRRGSSTWQQEAYIKAVNSHAGDGATSVALFGDTLAVGKNSEDGCQTTITNGPDADANNSGTNTGAVYVYRRTGTEWIQEAYIKASNGMSGTLAKNFAFKGLAVSGDTIAVGASSDGGNQTTITNDATSSVNQTVATSGAVYLYRRNGTSWAQEAYVKALRNKASYSFSAEGLSLAGDTLAVATKNDASNQTFISNGSNVPSDTATSNVGAVWLYRRTGTTWAHEAFVKTFTAKASDQFSNVSGVAVSGDTLAVGQALDKSNQTAITNGPTASADTSATTSGAVWVYRNRDRMFEPNIRVASKTATSITFAWSSNVLGSGTMVKVAPVVTGNTDAAAYCAGGTLLNPGDTSYNYPSLATGTKYGFRFCAWDGTSASYGVPIWATTD